MVLPQEAENSAETGVGTWLSKACPSSLLSLNPSPEGSAEFKIIVQAGAQPLNHEPEGVFQIQTITPGRLSGRQQIEIATASVLNLKTRQLGDCPILASQERVQFPAM